MFYQIGDAEIFESERLKMLNSPSYNFLFRKTDGFFVRTGQTIMDDPTHSIYGPEIADIEISSASKTDIDHYYDVNKVSSLEKYNIVTKGGCNGIGCKDFCYKGSLKHNLKIEYEDGSSEILSPNQYVTLADGTRCRAKDLKIGQNIL